MTGLETPGARPIKTLVPVRVPVKGGKQVMMVGVATRIASGCSLVCGALPPAADRLILS